MKARRQPRQSTRSNRSQPIIKSSSEEMQTFDQVIADLPFGLSLEVREESVRHLNQILAETITLRDLYKKCHWQVSGPTFYSLHLLFDKHAQEQTKLVDEVAERIQTLGGVAAGMAHETADRTMIERPPTGREPVSAQLSRLLEAHRVVLQQVRAAAHRAGDSGDDGTNDLLVSSLLRTNETQVWFLYEHLVKTDLLPTT